MKDKKLNKYVSTWQCDVCGDQHIISRIERDQYGNEFITLKECGCKADNDYESRVQELEAEGMTRSDAQGVADAELML